MLPSQPKNIMKFRPCIDVHNGLVKQIVGSTLSDDLKESPVENFSSASPPSFYARLYKDDGLPGGHIILLGPNNEDVAIEALREFPQGLHLGGGVNLDNAMKYIDAGASHIIVTSYVFHNGVIQYDRLEQLVSLVGKNRLVLDLSCRRKPDDPSGSFYVVTNKWTKFTEFAVNEESLQSLSNYCDEFLVHGVDVEGKMCGIEEDLVALLGKYSPIPVTYAGGVRSIEDLELIRRIGDNRVDCTVGSALDLFGGQLPYREVVAWHHSNSLQTAVIS